MRSRYVITIVSVLGLIVLSLGRCQWHEQERGTPTIPKVGRSDLSNYAQMDGGSTVVNGIIPLDVLSPFVTFYATASV